MHETGHARTKVALETLGYTVTERDNGPEVPSGSGVLVVLSTGSGMTGGVARGLTSEELGAALEALRGPLNAELAIMAAADAADHPPDD